MAFEQRTQRNPTAISLFEPKAEFFLHQRTSMHSAKTLEYYEYVLGRFSKWLEPQGTTLVEDIDASLIRRFLLDLEGQVKPNTVGIAETIEKRA